MATVNWKPVLEPDGMDELEQVTVPLAPTAGVMQVHPPTEDNDTNVVPAGRESVQDTFSAVCGPRLATEMV
jgi:hypothetical protein